MTILLYSLTVPILHDYSPVMLTTFASLDTLAPEARESGQTLSGRDWIIDTSKHPLIYDRSGEIHLNEYDALAEVKYFLDIARTTYEEAGRADRMDEVDRFAKGIAYLSSQAFAYATSAISESWIDRLDSGVKLAAALPSAYDTKDRQVASSEYILTHVLENIRHKCGAAAVKSIALLAPGAEVTPDGHNCDTIEYIDDWYITGRQLRRNINMYPDELREKISVQLLVKRGLVNTLDLGNNMSVSLSGIYELPVLDDVHAGPSVVGAHSSVNYGWQNRLIEFGQNIANVSSNHRATLPLMIHIERPYRTRRDTPSFFKRIEISNITQPPAPTEQYQ